MLIPPSPAANRMNRYRRNSRLGRKVIPPMAIDVSVIQRLIELGRLAIADCDDGYAIRDALEASTVEIK